MIEETCAQGEVMPRNWAFTARDRATIRRAPRARRTVYVRGMRTVLPAVLVPLAASFLLAACNRGAGAQDAAPAGTTATPAMPATGGTAAPATADAPPATPGLPALGTGTAARPMIKLTDGGLAPAPVADGGAFAIPSGLKLPPMPSGMPSAITIPTTFQIPSALPTALPSAWPPPPR